LRHSVAIRIVEGNVLAFEVTEIAQPVTEGVPVERVVDNADARDLARLLRGRRERPRRRAAESEDERASPQLDHLGGNGRWAGRDSVQIPGYAIAPALQLVSYRERASVSRSVGRTICETVGQNERDP